VETVKIQKKAIRPADSINLILLQALFSNLKQSKSMIYKIFLPVATLVVSFLQAICSSQRLKQNKAENKTEVAKTKKNL
jgi:hypothetical protein